jgi:hypothetical protein
MGPRTTAVLPERIRAARCGFQDPRYSSWTPTDEQYYLKNFNLGLEEALNAARARMIEIERVRQTE